MGRKPISYDDFQHLVAVGALGFFHFDGEAPLDRFLDVAHQFVQGFALGGTPWNGRDFRPKTAFLRLMNHNLDLQAPPPLDVSYAAFTSKANRPAANTAQSGHAGSRIWDSGLGAWRQKKLSAISVQLSASKNKKAVS